MWTTSLDFVNGSTTCTFGRRSVDYVATSRRSPARSYRPHKASEIVVRHGPFVGIVGFHSVAGDLLVLSCQTTREGSEIGDLR